MWNEKPLCLFTEKTREFMQPSAHGHELSHALRRTEDNLVKINKMLGKET